MVDEIYSVDKVAAEYLLLDAKRQYIITKAFCSPVVGLLYVHGYDEVRVISDGTRSELLNMMGIMFPPLLDEGIPKDDGGTYFMGVGAELVCDIARVLYDHGKDQYDWEEGFESFIADVITRLHQEVYDSDE